MEQRIRAAFTIVPAAYGTPESPRDGFRFSIDGVEYMLPIDVVAEFCAAAPVLTADALKELDPQDQRGWHGFFDAWRTAGVIG